MNDEQRRAEEWVDAYAAAWRAGDAEASASLFAEDCSMRSHPFREPEDAREYTRREFGRERAREVWFGTPVIQGTRAAVEYWAAMEEDGQEVTLAGCCVLDLGPDGRCRSLRDYWAMQPGRTPPPEGWGQ
jgi:SnoaL-like domain